MGVALWFAQQGKRHPAASPLKGPKFGGVMEIRDDHDRSAERPTVKRPISPAFEIGSGNVFADLGFSHPEEELAKAQLVFQIVQLVRARDLTQMAAGELLGLPQPKVSLLLRGKMGGFSTDRLIRFLNRLDQDIEIVVRSKPDGVRPARVRVVRRGASVTTPPLRRAMQRPDRR